MTGAFCYRQFFSGVEHGYALLFGDELDVLDCEGRSAWHELFIEQLGDKARITMGTCPGEDLVSLVLRYFTEEDQKLTVEEDLLPACLATGVQQRRLCAKSTDVALSNILRDERQRISSIALAGYQGGAYRPTEGLAGVIEYPSMRGTLSGEIWRWFVYPAKPLSVSWSVPRTDVVVPTMDTESSTLPMVTDAAEADVDLVAVAEGMVAALREETTVPTILDVFQESTGRESTEGGRTATSVGLGGTHGGDIGRDGCPPFHEGLCLLLSTEGVG